jgi:hypothetical protein
MFIMDCTVRVFPATITPFDGSDFLSSTVIMGMNEGIKFA